MNEHKIPLYLSMADMLCLESIISYAQTQYKAQSQEYELRAERIMAWTEPDPEFAELERAQAKRGLECAADAERIGRIVHEARRADLDRILRKSPAHS